MCAKFMPMQETIKCPGCGEDFERINRTRNHIIIKKNGRPRVFCEECAAYRKTRKGRRESKAAHESGGIE